jgi:pilus assembly protein Flp/PilA
MERIRNFLQDESGATAVEYSLLVALISITCAVVISALGIKLGGVFTKANSSAPAAPAAVPAPPANSGKM